MCMTRTKSGTSIVKRIIFVFRLGDFKGRIAFKAKEFDFLLKDGTFDHEPLEKFIKELYPDAKVDAMCSSE